MLNIGAISSVISNPTWDLLAVLFFIATGFFYGISVGRIRMVVTLFSIYVSHLLMLHFHFLDFVIEGRALMEVFLFRIVIFLGLIIVLSHLFKKTVFRGAPEEKKPWWKIFLLSFLEVGLLMSSIFILLPVGELFTFSPLVNFLFASGNAFFWWLILPLITLFIIL